MACTDHAVNLALFVRQTMGVRAFAVDVKNSKAAKYYQARGFGATLDDALTLYLPLGKAVE